MTITSKEVFMTDGKEFRTFEDAESHREDLIGRFIDKANCNMHPRDKLSLHKYILENRQLLANLLDY